MVKSTFMSDNFSKSAPRLYSCHNQTFKVYFLDEAGYKCEDCNHHSAFYQLDKIL
jgi:hypothetical protein